MITAKILLVGGGDKIIETLRKPFQEASRDVEISHIFDTDEALHGLVVGGYQLCVIEHNPKNISFALDICDGAKEAGLRTPIIVLMHADDPTVEMELIKAGSYIAQSKDGAPNSMLRNLVNLTVDLRRTEETLRKSNDRLMMEMRTLQDERERAEALGSEYIELMENYALAKDELEKINQEKNKFFSIIAHDLRSPFTGLIGFSRLLKDGAETFPSDKIQVFANHIHDSSTNIFSLLENLLEWARLQMNRVSVTPSLFPILDSTQKAFSVLGPVALEKEITLAESGHAPTVYADPLMTDTVIRNLVNNAIKFTPHGGSITVIYDTLADAKIAKISVRDTGVGMNENNAGKLFKMSENVSTRGTDGEAGTGLGLLLCAELIQRNNGTITAASTKDKGSTFTITLPLFAPEE